MGLWNITFSLQRHIINMMQYQKWTQPNNVLFMYKYVCENFVKKIE